MKKVFELMTNAIKGTSQDIAKTITESSVKNNQALESLNGKVLKLLNDNGMIAPYLAPSFVNLFRLENKSQLLFKKGPWFN